MPYKKIGTTIRNAAGTILERKTYEDLSGHTLRKIPGGTLLTTRGERGKFRGAEVQVGKGKVHIGAGFDIKRKSGGADVTTGKVFHGGADVDIRKKRIRTNIQVGEKRKVFKLGR